MTLVLSDPAEAFRAKRAFLSSLPGIEEVIETHMSLIFLSHSHAFKLKKPVRMPNFDHRSLHAREAACREEFRLNHELAGDVYLGVWALRQHPDESFALGSDGGEIVDWLVCMKRLPARQMLDQRILDGLAGTSLGPTPAEIGNVARLLARFYAARQQNPPRKGLYLEHLKSEHDRNVRHLNSLAHHLQGLDIAPLLSGIFERLVRMEPEIAARETAQLIVEGHGDLRPEHVCLCRPIVIFDRVETGLPMRLVDIYDELGYLACECALLGLPDPTTQLFNPIMALGLMPPSRGLQTTYTLFRLVTRARLSLDHLRDVDCKTPEKWVTRARNYLSAANRVLLRERRRA